VYRRHCVGGGAPVNFGRQRRCAASPKKSAAAALVHKTQTSLNDRVDKNHDFHFKKSKKLDLFDLNRIF